MYSSPFVTGVGVGVGLELGSPLPYKFIFNLTPPPDNQNVYRVWRYVNNQRLCRANLIAALRQKYGPETTRFVGPTQTDEAHATEFLWLFDQSEHPAPLPNSSDLYGTITTCAGMFGDNGTSVPAFSEGNLTTTANRQLIQPGGWCNSSMIAVIANFNATQIHVVDRVFLRPVGDAVRGIAGFLAGMHHGRLNAYVVYALAFLLLMLLVYRVT